MSNKTMPVFASGMYIKDNGNLVIHADEMDAAGVRKVELVEGEAPDEICECGHSADTHDPCCVSACGCDGFEPRKPSIEDVFKAVMREIKDIAQGVLPRDVICHPIQAVRRLAQEFATVKAQLAEAKRVWKVADDERVTARAQLKKAEADAASLHQQLADARDYNERAPKLAAEVGNARAEKAEAEAARFREELERIANSKRRDFPNAEDFRGWARMRANLALNPAAPAEGGKE